MSSDRRRAVRLGSDRAAPTIEPGRLRPRAGVDVAVAASLEPEGVAAGLATIGLNYRPYVSRLLADEARRRDEVERRRDEFRLILNCIDRHRDGVVDRWTGPGARSGDPRPKGAPPWDDSHRGCSRCGSDEGVALASVHPDVWLCGECRRR